MLVSTAGPTEKHFGVCLCVLVLFVFAVSVFVGGVFLAREEQSPTPKILEQANKQNGTRQQDPNEQTI